VASFVIPLIAAALTATAVWTRVWLLLWPAVVLLAVAFVYFARAPGAFGKRLDGTHAWWAWLAWAPMFAYMRLMHEAARSLTKEPVANEVAPGIWVGRRPRPHELPPGVAIVVDLCAELAELRAVSTRQAYLAIPTLDATSPTPDQLAHAVDTIVDTMARTGGAAFIHCAFGHGRSATVAAAVLIRRGEATLDDVERKMKAIRPRIGLNPLQLDALSRSLDVTTASRPA
jgi:protein-tyrosine phosphatase